MTKKHKDIGASVKAQLLRLARERGDDYQLILLRYANERLLYRLAVSPQAQHYVLKGAALFTLWTAVADDAANRNQTTPGDRCGIVRCGTPQHCEMAGTCREQNAGQ